MTETPSLEVPAREESRLLKFSRLGIIVALLLIAVGVGAVIYVTTMGDKLYTIEQTAKETPFDQELNFGSDEQLMFTLSHLGGQRASDAVDKIVAARDRRFIPVLIEMLDAGETQPIVFGAGARKHIVALRELANTDPRHSQSEESLSRQWRAWFAATDIAAPDGFTAWKGKLYGRFDRQLEDFFKNEFSPKVRVSEIFYGGVKIDAIPSLDRPAMIAAGNADYVQPDEPVFGIEVNGDARAYPQRIIDWHELVNDEIGGMPVVFTYCPLAGAGIAYEARATDMKTYTFGTSGLVYRSNKLMYDRETNTLWNQFTGTPALGPLSASDVRLKRIPIVLTTWNAWKLSHPATTVLDLNTGFKRRYEPAASYGDYYSNDRVMFPVVPPGDALPRKDRIYGVLVENTSKAFPVKTLTTQKVVNDSVGNTAIVLVAQEGMVSVSGRIRRRGERMMATYSVGGAVRAYERGTQTFQAGSDAGTILDGSGKVWKATEMALVGPDGQSLARLDGFESFWFAWCQFHSGTPVYR